MNVTFRCPHCDQTARVELEAALRELACPHCQAKWPVEGRSTGAEKLEGCLICPSTELFIRKDFSQPLGVAIVALGFVVSSVFWYYRMPLWTYGVLFATALVDVVLYLTVGNLLQCYRCQAQYRSVGGLEEHEPFDLETHEKHRQQRIRLEKSEARS
jgi:DNA-directed RNA polymerase subunit RPC12/RpoP